MQFVVSWSNSEIECENARDVMQLVNRLATESLDVLDTVVINSSCGYVYSLVFGGALSVANYWQVDGVPPAFITGSEGAGMDLVCRYYDSTNEFEARNTIPVNDALNGLAEFLRNPSECPRVESLRWEKV